MTSTWIQSAPAASTASISAPSLEKSAERIDGAMRTGLAISLSAGFWDRLQCSTIPCHSQKQDQAGQPHDPGLVAVMGIGKSAANDGIADQSQQHQGREARRVPEPL